MNRGCQALSLISRCRNAFRPTLPSRGLLQQCSIAYKQQRGLCSDHENYECRDGFPSLPIQTPVQFCFESSKKLAAVLQWAKREGFKPETIHECLEASEDIIKFITERMSEEDFETLEEKFLPDVLERARNIVSNIPFEERKDLIYQKMNFFGTTVMSFPWQFYSDHPYVVIGHFCLRQTFSTQTAWHVSLQILRDGSSLSEEYKISHFNYDQGGMFLQQ